MHNIAQNIVPLQTLGNEPKQKWNIENKLHRKRRKPFVLMPQTRKIIMK